MFELEDGMDGRRGSGPEVLWGPLTVIEDGTMTEVVAEARGAANVFFTFENIEDTIAYED